MFMALAVGVQGLIHRQQLDAAVHLVQVAAVAPEVVLLA